MLASLMNDAGIRINTGMMSFEPMRRPLTMLAIFLALVVCAYAFSMNVFAAGEEPAVNANVFDTHLNVQSESP